MWIKKQHYDRIMERLGDNERAERLNQHIAQQAQMECTELRKELHYLRDLHHTLTEALGLSYRRIAARSEYAKKGGPERGNGT